eukprot:3430161-Pyramimonas_sp.AAC.1
MRSATEPRRRGLPAARRSRGEGGQRRSPQRSEEEGPSSSDRSGLLSQGGPFLRKGPAKRRAEAP